MTTDYLLLYSGGSMPETEEEQATVMKAWDAWMHDLGSALKDGGNPFAPGAAKTIAADGAVRDGAGSASGYSVISADSLDDAATNGEGVPRAPGRRDDRGVRDLLGDVAEPRRGSAAPAEAGPRILDGDHERVQLVALQGEVASLETSGLERRPHLLR